MEPKHANSIILRLEPEGKITFINEFAQAFFGYRKEILGRNVVGTIVPPIDSQGRDLSSLIHEICAHHETFVNHQNENMRQNGERVWIAWTNKPIFNEEGKVVFHI